MKPERYSHTQEEAEIEAQKIKQRLPPDPSRIDYEVAEQQVEHQAPLEERAEEIVANLILSPQNSLYEHDKLKRIILKRKTNDLDLSDLTFFFEKLKEKIFTKAFAKEIQELKESFEILKPVEYTPELIEKLIPEAYPFVKKLYGLNQHKVNWKKVAPLIGIPAENFTIESAKTRSEKRPPKAKSESDSTELSGESTNTSQIPDNQEPKIDDDLNSTWERTGTAVKLFSLIAEENKELIDITPKIISESLIDQIKARLRMSRKGTRTVDVSKMEYANLRKKDGQYSFKVYFEINGQNFGPKCDLTFVSIKGGKDLKKLTTKFTCRWSILFNR